MGAQRPKSIQSEAHNRVLRVQSEQNIEKTAPPMVLTDKEKIVLPMVQRGCPFLMKLEGLTVT